MIGRPHWGNKETPNATLQWIHTNRIAALVLSLAVIAPLRSAEQPSTPPDTTPQPRAQSVKQAPRAEQDQPYRLPSVEENQPPITQEFPKDLHLNKTPPRAIGGLELEKLGWKYSCTECHRMLEAKWHFDRPMSEHREVRLEHGNNRFCLNCHHPDNRSVFVDYDGSEIAETAVVSLCARCHGPTHRDWESGVHGRRNGFWDTQRGEQSQLSCIQCHDPHRPRFQAMKPLPPPRYPRRAAHSPFGGGTEPTHPPSTPATAMPGTEGTTSSLNP